MTREEAQDRLQRMSNQATEFVKSSPSHYWSDIYRKDAEALEMAIEALNADVLEFGKWYSFEKGYVLRIEGNDAFMISKDEVLTSDD